MDTPACFSAYRWASWNEAVQAQLDLKDRPENYCTDCLPEYQEAMIEDGKCAHPETRFFLLGPPEECSPVGFRNPPERVIANFKEYFVGE